jgi:hypothetical protein
MAASISSATTARAVTTSDTNTIGGCRGIYVGGAGNVVCDFADGQTNVTFTAVPAGTVLPIQPLRIKTASTATSIVALY